MKELRNKIEETRDLLTTYTDQILEAARAQIEVVLELYVQPDRFGKRRSWNLPRNPNNWFRAHEYLDYNLNYMTIEFWCKDDAVSEGDMTLHPIFEDLSVPLEERKAKFREFLTEYKAKGDKSTAELNRALLEQQRKQLESQLAAIDHQLKDGD